MGLVASGQSPQMFFFVWEPVLRASHDIENDLADTIPPEGGWDSRWLFRAMTERSLALLDLPGAASVLDLACGMGQDTLAAAEAMGSADESGRDGQGFTLGLEPSNRMIRYAQGESRRRGGQGGLSWVRGFGEELPFCAGSFDAVLCKGALDHFMEPATAVSEMARVLKPGGRMVLALANYDSLSCRLGRILAGAPSGSANGNIDRGEEEGSPRPYYEPPPDHMTRFGYSNIRTLAGPPLTLTRLEGLSLLWGFPPWSRLVGGLPPGPREVIRRGLFTLGRALPGWADVIVLQATKRDKQ